MTKPTVLDMAQDYLDCVTGVHGAAWQYAAHAFIEKNAEASPSPWGEWWAMRQTPLLALDDEDGCRHRPRPKGVVPVTTQTLTLTDFLLARIADDENRARCAGHGDGRVITHNADWGVVVLPDNARPIYDVRFIRDFSPFRVLAECKAKRAIVEYLAPNRSTGDPLHPVIRALASVYADHPDYREEWR